jgi:hypothetical protein
MWCNCQLNVFAARAVDGWFEPKSGTIKLVFVASQLGTKHLGERAKTGWLGFMIMRPSGAASLSSD